MEDAPEFAVPGAGFAIPGSTAHAMAAEWDARVDSWSAVCAGPAFRRFRDRVLAESGPRAHEEVVDIGCGTGLLALEFARRARKVWALDLSPGMVEAIGRNAADRGLGNIVALQADARSLPLPDESVDIAASCYTLHHVGDDGKVMALEEAWRVLRPGGRLVVIDMMFDVSLRASDRRIIGRKAVQLIRKGPAGVIRLMRNGARLARGDWEKPAGLGWWQAAARECGFADAITARLEQEAGLLVARKPL